MKSFISCKYKKKKDVTKITYKNELWSLILTNSNEGQMDTEDDIANLYMTCCAGKYEFG